MESQHDIFLVTRDLDVGYRNGRRVTTLLSGINVDVRRGQMTALLGRNGAGKSTLLRALTCFTRPLKGRVELAGSGVALHDMTYAERSRFVGLVTTERMLAGALTVQEMVEMGRQPYTGVLGRLGRHDHEVVDEALEQVGIAHKRHEMLAGLSDGERQKVMIAKALAQRTPLIVLDEPTAFLDVESRMEVMKLLHKLAHDEGKAIILSTHDIAQALMLADTLWVITRDNTLIAGPTEDLVTNGTMNSVFNDDNLSFNAAIGDYEARVETSRTVTLDCPDDTLRYAATALLLRHGIAVNAQATGHTGIVVHTPADLVALRATLTQERQ